jgi:uncharacterized protein
MMAPDVARAAVDRLIADAEPGIDLVFGYMGGEPLLARGLVHEVTRYAARAAHEAGHRIRFSMTTKASAGFGDTSTAAKPTSSKPRPIR